MTERYLVANWKMNLPAEGVAAWLQAMSDAGDDPHLVVAPPFPFLRDVWKGGAVALAGQNCSDQPSGAFTGEVSASMLRGCGAEYVILGHSERRNLYHENDALVARKLQLAIETGLKPILCIGEDLAIRESGQFRQVLSDQIRATAVSALDQEGASVVIAYEPVWAIGTGKNATGPMVAETLIGIRSAVEQFWPARVRNVSILYGGSVTPENVDDLVERGTIDGFLVGGASLFSSKFLAIRAGMR